MRYFITLGITALCTSLAFGQVAQRQVVSSYGGSASSSSIYVSHTAGQPLSGTETAGSITLTQGFEQGDVSRISLDEETFGEFSIFPNPATRELQFEVTQFEGSTLNVRIYDLSGKIVFGNKWTGINKEIKKGIRVDHLASGEYLLEISNDDGIKKVFQFIKK